MKKIKLIIKEIIKNKKEICQTRIYAEIHVTRNVFEASGALCIFFFKKKIKKQKQF